MKTCRKIILQWIVSRTVCMENSRKTQKIHSSFCSLSSFKVAIELVKFLDSELRCLWNRNSVRLVIKDQKPKKKWKKVLQHKRSIVNNQYVFILRLEKTYFVINQITERSSNILYVAFEMPKSVADTIKIYVEKTLRNYN